MLTMCSPLWIQLYFPSSCDLLVIVVENDDRTFIDFILPSQRNDSLPFASREKISSLKSIPGEKKRNFAELCRTLLK